MVKHDGEIILPVFFLNAIGICFLFLIEGEVFTSDNSNRTLKENSQLNYFHTNLRGSILKININRNINNISNINNEIDTLKTFNENETIEDKKQLRKLIQNTYLFYFNIFPAFISLIIIFSFGAEEEGHCELNDCGEGTFFFLVIQILKNIITITIIIIGIMMMKMMMMMTMTKMIYLKLVYSFVL